MNYIQRIIIKTLGIERIVNQRVAVALAGEFGEELNNRISDCETKVEEFESQYLQEGDVDDRIESYLNANDLDSYSIENKVEETVDEKVEEKLDEFRSELSDSMQEAVAKAIEDFKPESIDEAKVKAIVVKALKEIVDKAVDNG